MGEHILLIGMMGAGKTTIGSLLADKLGRPYIDNDRQVEHMTGMTVPEIWQKEGEEAFRRQEAAAVQAAAASPRPAVIGVAGGAVLDADNRKAIAEAGTVVWLRAETDTLAGRVGEGEGRPLLSGPEGAAKALAQLQEDRRPLYAELADIVIDVDGLEIEEVLDRVLRSLPAA